MYDTIYVEKDVIKEKNSPRVSWLLLMCFKSVPLCYVKGLQVVFVRRQPLQREYQAVASVFPDVWMVRKTLIPQLEFLHRLINNLPVYIDNNAHCSAHFTSIIYAAPCQTSFHNPWLCAVKQNNPVVPFKIKTQDLHFRVLRHYQNIQYATFFHILYKSV